MKKHNSLFAGMIALSAGFFSLIVTDTVLDALRAKQAAEIGQSVDDPARTAALRKKFEDMGLTLHEAMYWKKIK